MEGTRRFMAVRVGEGTHPTEHDAVIFIEMYSPSKQQHLSPSSPPYTYTVNSPLQVHSN